MPTKRLCPICLICHRAHPTWQHVDEPVWDLDVAALACIVIGGAGLLASLLTALTH